MKDPIIGIDLGTTNSVAAVVDESGAPQVLADGKGFKIQPSVVSFHPNGSVVVGADAKQRRIIDPPNTIYSVKRLIGRTFKSRQVAKAASRMPYTIKQGVNDQPVIATRAGEFAIPEISAIVLDHMRSLARTALDTEVSRAVVTVPANFTEAQRSATATAGAIAGIVVARVINEPTAAAIAYGHGRTARETIAVYDFGGGTFDVTILKLHDDVYEVLATAGDTFLGGDDIDERLVDHMAQVFLEQSRTDLRGDELAMQRLRAVAEQTKIELSRRSRAVIKVDEIAYGPGGTPLDLELNLSRDEFLVKIADIIDNTFPVCRNALQLAGLGANDIDEVVLVGGTTKMPYVRERVANFFGKSPRSDVNPDEAVAVGAAIQGQALSLLLQPDARRTTRAASVAPPSPPMEARPPGRATPPPPPADEVARKIAPSPRHTMPRVASTAQREAQPEEPTATRVIEPDEPTDVGTQPKLKLKRRTLPGSIPPPPPGVPTPAPEPGAPIGRIQPLQRPAKPAKRATPPPTPAATPPPDSDFAEDTSAFTRPRPPRPFARESGDLDFESVATGVATNVGTKPGEGSATRVDDEARAPAPPASKAAPAEPAPRVDDGTRTEPAPRLDPDALFARAESAAETTIPAAAETMPAAAQPAPRAPKVLDVLPQAVGIGTVAGFCEELIGRNSQLPAETTRVFSTSQDFQDMVRIRVCLGQSRRIAENAILGEVVLANLPARRRAETKIAVTFAVDANGILAVAARDEKSGAEQTARLHVIGAQSAEQIEDAKRRFQVLKGR